MTNRMAPKDRTAAILEAAIIAASKVGFGSMRLHHVASAAECSNSLVISYYSTMTKLRRAVMRAAIKRELLPIIANGVVVKDPTAMKADKALRNAALKSLTND